jgi:hypothetical protein
MDTNDNPVFLPCVSYHLPQTDVRLFSPQTYHQMHGGYSEVYGQSIQMKLRTSSILIDINGDHANLPIVHDSFVSEKAKRGLCATYAVWSLPGAPFGFGLLWGETHFCLTHCCQR